MKIAMKEEHCRFCLIGRARVAKGDYEMMLDEKTKKLGELLADLRNHHQAMAESIDAFLSYLGQKIEEKWNWNPNKIKWVQETGFKGPYERYPAKDQKSEATDDYKRMLEDLKARGGKVTRDGLFYWVFEDASTVGRKKRARQ